MKNHLRREAGDSDKRPDRILAPAQSDADPSLPFSRGSRLNRYSRQRNYYEILARGTGECRQVTPEHPSRVQERGGKKTQDEPGQDGLDIVAARTGPASYDGAANASEIGMIIVVRASLVIAAQSPAALLKEYPAATTEDVSFIAVPAHSPKPLSCR